MRRTLISRPNVERVMRMVDLDVKAKDTREHEEMVDLLMKQITIAGTERDDIYTISYSAPNPKLGRDVVQSLLTIFVEGSFGGKKQDSDKAVQFIDDQIKTYEEKLAAAENSLKEFKIRHNGVLPRTGGGDFGGQMAGASDALMQARLELAEAEQARNTSRRQITGDVRPGTKAARSWPIRNSMPVSPTVNKNLDTLRMQYTEQHPDIVAARRLLEQLQERKKGRSQDAETQQRSGRRLQPDAAADERGPVGSRSARRLAARPRQRIRGARRRLRRQSVQAPEIEAQLAQLNRDYEVNKENYQKLVARREGGQAVGRPVLGHRHADLPRDRSANRAADTPSGPNRLRLFSLVFAGALIAGLGAALLMSQFRPTFLSQSTLREVAGVPVLGAITMNWTDRAEGPPQAPPVCLGAAVLVLFGVYGAGVAAMLVRPTL